MKHIITIQHTQSEQHVNRMIGSWAEWDLTELGIRQAHRIGERLYAELNGEPYVIYSSDLLRARHTAEIVAEYFHTSPVYDAALREFDLGEAVGMSKECARTHVTCPVWPHTVDRAESVDGRPFRGAESVRNVWERLFPFYRQIMESNSEQIILVSHDGTLSVFFAMWLRWQVEMLETSRLFGKSGGVSFLREDEAGHRIIERLNDMSYIE